MAQYQQQWPIAVLCEVLESSRSGFYAYVHRRTLPRRDTAEEALVARGKAIAAETWCSSGSRRRAKQLQDEGFTVGRHTVRRLMRQAAVTVERPQKRPPRTTDSRHPYPVAPNLLARQCDVVQPKTVWVGDMTYVWTAAGWEYLAVLLDVHSRTVVGWAMQSRMDASLVQEALRMALGRRRPAAGLLHHADRGSQYAGQAYQHLRAANDLRCSMRRKGEC